MVAQANQHDTVTTRATPRATKQRQLLARRSKLLQVLEMQEELRDEMKGALQPMQRAALISAWDKLEERLRILRNKPLPGSLSHEKRLPRGATRKAAQLSALASYATEPGRPMPDASQDQGPGA